MFTSEDFKKGTLIINTQLRCANIINELQHLRMNSAIEVSPREILNYCDLLEYFNDADDTLDNKAECAEILNKYLEQ